ncbi:MAG: YbbR-like domain-containing protein [Candidatus Brocadiales bacterium]
MVKEALLGNWGAKLMALSMAIALWSYATGKYTGELACEIPVQISYPPDYTLLQQSTTELKVKLKGPKQGIDYVSALLRSKELRARCEISGEGRPAIDLLEEVVMLDRKNFNLPPEIKLESLNPDNVRVTLGKLEEKTLQVNLQKKGEPAEGYVLAGEFFYPSQVQVYGPASLLKEAKGISTTVIDISNLTSDQNRTFPWRVPLEQKVILHNNGETVEVPVKCDKQITVWLQLTEQPDSKTFQKVKIKLLQPPNFPHKIKLQEEDIDIKIKGPKLALDKLSPPEVYIDVSGLEPPGPYKRPLKCTLPPQVELEEALPEVHLDFQQEEKTKK